MTKLNTYSASGVKKTSLDMPKAWQEKENLVLLAQAIRVYEANRHPGLSKVKTRGEVSYSTRKIYRQKGTGLARHGDRGAPIFVKGGAAHGPKGIKRKLKIAKKMAQKALKVALTIKSKEGQLLFVDNTSQLKKTKQAADLIDKIINKEKNIGQNSRFTFALSNKNKDRRRVLRNLKNVEVITFKNLNAYRVFFGGVLVIDKEVVKEAGESQVVRKLEDRREKKAVSKVETKKVVGKAKPEKTPSRKRKAKPSSQGKVAKSAKKP